MTQFKDYFGYVFAMCAGLFLALSLAYASTAAADKDPCAWIIAEGRSVLAQAAPKTGVRTYGPQFRTETFTEATALFTYYLACRKERE